MYTPQSQSAHPVIIIMVEMQHVELDAAVVMKTAHELCQEDSMLELKNRGPLPACRKMSPLSPPLRMDEYHMMERDRGKCTV